MEGGGRHVGRRRLAIALLPLLLVGLACSDADDADGTAPTSTTVPGRDAGSAIVQRLDVRTDVYVDGFRMAIGTVDVRVDRFQRWFADVTGSLANLGPEPATPATPMTIELGGQRWTAPIDLDEPVAAGAEIDLVVAVPLPDRRDLIGAVLLVGGPGTNQASVPLVVTTPAVTNAPVVDRVDAEVVAGELRVQVRSVEVRADDPLGHETLARGRLLVVLTFDVRRGAGGDPTVGADNLRLGLPDGTLVATRPDGRSSPNLVLDAGGVAEGATARFEVPAPSGGRYQLVVTGPYEPFGDDAQGSAEFRVPDIRDPDVSEVTR